MALYKFKQFVKDVRTIKNSPFIKPMPRWYFGELNYGIPYFYPKKKISLDFVCHGWKTKWTPEDIRHEWTPAVSFRFFNWQIFWTYETPESKGFIDDYWELLLKYSNLGEGDNKIDRLYQLDKKYCVRYDEYTSNEETIKVDHYKEFLSPDMYIAYITHAFLQDNMDQFKTEQNF